MQSTSFCLLLRAGAVASLALLVSVSCSHKPTTTDNTTAAATGSTDAPPSAAVENKDMLTDPMGSDSGKIAGLSTVYFEYDQAKLTGDTKRKFAENADWIKAHSNFTIQVEGHTDARGSVEYNLALGERRAKSVKSYLESLGIDSKRITIISYGKEKPIDPGDSESAWAKNRRANFVPIQ
jgi:peptidoglycan-associated lipoprotein